MNITEANAVNVVLRALIATEEARGDLEAGTSGESGASCAVTPDVLEAAALLADRANKALNAGMTDAQVRERLA